ncbi:uncharacterized protein JN550_002851 [Neoarthrinium moseri]|uniref:uncharacterized protein n=1 Tax=Neoarthrinium moseri TaxID=1658444 RepID=UPI001FDC5634|nr:uncharacterized protein JN550_002851 [Neoarthrinium moseri]KAI1874272.1 hypothetical protein JN550_002851 [Neoarthrinium moseri]
MDSKAPVSSNKHRGYATSHDWAQNRARITQLYQDESRPLREVMDIMANKYNFNATERMYKKRIGDWGIDKKLKEDDLLQILRILALRSHLVGNSDDLVFFVRGRRLVDTRLLRSISRRSKALKRFHAGEMPCPESIKAVQYQKLGPACGNTAFAQDDRSESVEKLFRLIRHCVLSSIDSQTWMFDDTACWSASSTATEQLELHDGWHLPFFSLASYLQGDLNADAIGKELSTLFDFLPQIIKAQPPFFLPCLLGMLLRLHQLKQAYLIDIMMRHISQLSCIYLGPHHPLFCVIKHLRSLSRGIEDDFYWYEQSLLTLTDQFETQIGLENNITILTATAYLAALCMNGGITLDWLKLTGKYTFKLADYTTRLDTWDDLEVSQSRWNLDCFSRNPTAVQARRLLLPVLFEGSRYRSNLTDTGVAFQESQITAMDLARRHFKYHLAHATLSAGNWSLFQDFCALLPESAPLLGTNRSSAVRK